MSQIPDARNILNGFDIPAGEGYADQPYVVITKDGDWLCVITTGAGEEGQSGQHIISTISSDKGRSWSLPVKIESPEGPEASWALPVIVPSGRIYVFYNYNKENIRKVVCDTNFRKEGYTTRVDSLGVMAYKYSDDSGKSWSEQRWEIPIRKMKCDYENPYKGQIQFFWGVGKPIVHDGAVYIGFAKIERFGKGFMYKSQGCFLKSKNILTETEPDKITWQTLPDGDCGLKSPVGPVSDEANLAGLSDGSLYCTYRTIDGHPCHAYSRDGGHTWTGPEFMTYTPGGRKIKHPRAANFVWRCSNGKLLYWFHNHGITGGRWAGPRPDAYRDRNPVWLSAGTEKDSPEGKVIHWSQPEIVIYDDDPLVRMSYPSLIEDSGSFYLTETQKKTARVHKIPDYIIEKLFSQDTVNQQAKDGVILELEDSRGLRGTFDMPPLPEFGEYNFSQLMYPTKDTRAGFTVEFTAAVNSLQPGQILLDTRSKAQIGLTVSVGEQANYVFRMFDGRNAAYWSSDPNTIQQGKQQHVVIIVDGGPKIISYIIDGRLNDGGEDRQFGWGRFNKYFYSLNHSDKLNISESSDLKLTLLRFYNRHLLTGEAVGNYRSEQKRMS
ncbi:Neuraminidase (sialidase) [Limihaloglobus sulfuriphilus]|uniref:Neuraminidase (Sialidase) n=1 Tax=Limihaloglobus sulfuriphilus TaxID=1851148 RepID=A0A1Q2MFS2_9BACT|nr:sialidase family protein [Limihaloglobus sulfuriphilus]AQQ71494.1 Neuraminidase (sialidase) [Limihaloglobus sulfuriphilus]